MTYGQIFLLVMCASATIGSGVATGLRIEPLQKKKWKLEDALAVFLGHFLGIGLTALIVWLVFR